MHGETLKIKHWSPL